MAGEVLTVRLVDWIDDETRTKIAILPKAFILSVA